MSIPEAVQFAGVIEGIILILILSRQLKKYLKRK